MYSLSIRSMVASAAAMHTGFPPNGVPCEPGFQRVTLSLAMIAPSGMPLAMPFAEHRMSGSIPAWSQAQHCRARHAARVPLRATQTLRFDPAVFTGPPLPRASHPRLHFVHDEHNAVLA